MSLLITHEGQALSRENMVEWKEHGIWSGADASGNPDCTIYQLCEPGQMPNISSLVNGGE